jgi:hypothetical protein
MEPKLNNLLNYNPWLTISMPIVQPTLKINVLKMEHVFQMGYLEGNKLFYVSPTN